MPTLRDALAFVRLVTRGGSERSFWSRAWVPSTHLLTELVSVLRAARPPRIVDVDEGWRHDRDVSLAVGRWGWLHLKTLMEEHENGACLFRVRARLRPSLVGTVRGATLAVAVAVATSASMFLYDRVVTAVVAAAGVVVIGLWTALQAIRGASILDRAIGRVITAAGMVEFPVASDLEPPVVGAPVSAPAPAVRSESTPEPSYAPAIETMPERRRRHIADASRTLRAPE